MLLVKIGLTLPKSHSKSQNKYKQDEIIQILYFLSTTYLSSLVDGCFNRRLVYGAPLTAYLFLRAYEADFLQWLLKNREQILAQTFNSSFNYLNYVLSLNNSQFGNYLHLLYPNELEVKDTTDTLKSVSYIDLHLEIDNEEKLKTHFTTNVMISLFQ